MVSGSNEQILLSYEQGMTPEQIAIDQELELMAVKATLMQCSSAYRKAVKAGEPDLDFTDSEAIEAKKILLSLARFSEDDNLRYRAACRIRDEKKGYLSVAQAMTGLQVNVNLFQAQLERANSALAISESKRADIESAKPIGLMSSLKDKINGIRSTKPVLEMEPA